MRKSLLLIMAISILLLCTSEIRAQQQAGFGDGFKVTLSKDYQMDKYLSFPGSSTFSDKKSNISLTSQKLKKGDVDINRQRENIVKQLKLSKFSVAESKTDKIGEYPMFLVKSSNNKGKTVYYQYGILVDRTIYMITCATTNSLAGKYEKEFQKTAESFTR